MGVRHIQDATAGGLGIRIRFEKKLETNIFSPRTTGEWEARRQIVKVRELSTQ